MHEEQGVAKDGGITTVGPLKHIKLKLDLTADKVVAANDAVIPAGSYIANAHLVVTAAAVGGTSINFGLANAAGAAIDADGIDAAVATAALAANKAVVCNGALVGGADGVGAADAYITTANTGTFTAGEAVLVISYIEV
tara:strand:- start:537 stop:953 length:417 start_codon:yes stop_codon:yes gene_type:complete